jgi:hypothetical protein
VRDRPLLAQLPDHGSERLAAPDFDGDGLRLVQRGKEQRVDGETDKEQGGDEERQES